MSAVPTQARADATRTGDSLVVRLGGVWRITRPLPAWPKVLAQAADGGPADRPRVVRLVLEEGERWDSSLVRFIYEVQCWCRAADAACDLAALPESVRRLVEQLARAQEKHVPSDHAQNFLTGVGLAAADLWRQTRDFANFVGECTLSAIGLVKRPGRFRWHDCFAEMQQCGAMALPIVSLISLLVGLIMAYQAAVQLRQFGADIFVADLVGLAVVREMGPMMAAVVLAGRTGAAFAAQIGNMKTGEEIDALETLGIPAVDFLVMPRLLALTLMMPLLALYANCLGILGGMIVSASVLEIPPSAYWIESQTIIDLSDVSSGLIKSVVFGILVAVAGCLRGLQCERSAAGVGRAATSAVVTGILLIIVADAVFAVLFNVLGL
ncbi:MAG: ABC transporter permease [Opitutaceae bacterium]|nr:ABC transporter permease [Opitutaceae bacterium]